MIQNLKEILYNIGYTSIKELPNEYRMRPIYRDSNNNTSLRIHRVTGNWKDFGAGLKGNFPELVKLTLNLLTLEEAGKLLEDKYQFVAPKHTPPVIRTQKFFDKTMLVDLVPQFDYWTNRKISEKTLRKFKGGVCMSGRMKNRFVFPIFDSKENILGFNGRDLTEKSEIKWKILGSKENFLYPLFVNWEAIKEKRIIILVESIGDSLALYESGIENSMVLFGTEISTGIINFLLKTDPLKIIIATNNEPSNASIGNLAAVKIENKLLKYFDRKQVKIKLPPEKDFNDMLIKNGKKALVEWSKL